MSEAKCEVEVIVRRAHEQIIEGLMELDVDQLRRGLDWSLQHYGKLDVKHLLEMAIELHEESRH